jgi:uncharacterized protein with NRDE domain
MCLIAFAWQCHPQYRLILAANRDERHDRASEKLHWWAESPGLLAGRDLEAGGTWLGITRSGRFATVTNYRETRTPATGVASRGNIVTEFARTDLAPDAFMNAIDGACYAGVNVLVSDGQSLGYVSNRGDGPTTLAAGVYGLSNAALDTPWSKLVRTREQLRALAESRRISRESLVSLLADRTVEAEPEIETDGLSTELARAITAPFIVSPDYGTRSTTALTWSHDNQVRIREARFDAAGNSIGESSFEFDVVQSDAP